MSRPKKVLVVTRSTVAHQGSGGMEGVAHDVIRHLSGHELQFSLLTTPGINAEKLQGVFQNIWTIDGAKAGKYSTRWWLRSASTRSDWHAWNPDVILSISRAATSFTFRSTWTRKTIVSQCHGTALKDVLSSLSAFSIKNTAKIPLNLARTTWECIAYRRFNKIISVGPAVTKYLVGKPLSIRASRVITIPNAVDTDHWTFSKSKRRSAREELGIPADARLAVFSGRLHRQKGADLAVAALSRLPCREWHLLICGEGPERETLERMCHRLGLSSRVHFAGFVSRERLSTFLSGADLFVFPTRVHEGLPMSVLEALASGLPVLTVPRANLPTDLHVDVVHSRLDAQSLSYDWSNVECHIDRFSRLPDHYDLNVMLRKYKELLLDC